MFDATPAMGAYSAFRQLELAAADPVGTQHCELMCLVNRAAATQFGDDHNFSAIKTVADFRERVPLRSYDDFYRDYWHPAFPQLLNCTWPGLIPYFALSSGTVSGASKYIPCSREMVLSNARAAHDVLVHHLSNRVWSRILGGKCLMLGGSTALKQEAPGIFSGDLSGIEAREVPWWEAPWVFPSRELATIPNWVEKIDKLAHASLSEDIRAISGVPNWMLLFFEKLLSLRPGTRHLAQLFPNLELIIHGGISLAPYRERFAQLLENSQAGTREVYAASEGFMAVADRGDGDGLRTHIRQWHFF